jgi:hypothetical protein
MCVGVRVCGFWFVQSEETRLPQRRCELSGEPMPVDVPAGLPSNAFVRMMMRSAAATLREQRPAFTARYGPLPSPAENNSKASKEKKYCTVRKINGCSHGRIRHTPYSSSEITPKFAAPIKPLYRGLHARRECLGFVPRSRGILAVAPCQPSADVPIRSCFSSCLSSGRRLEADRSTDAEQRVSLPVLKSALAAVLPGLSSMEMKLILIHLDAVTISNGWMNAAEVRPPTQ